MDPKINKVLELYDVVRQTLNSDDSIKPFDDVASTTNELRLIAKTAAQNRVAVERDLNARLDDVSQQCEQSRKEVLAARAELEAADAAEAQKKELLETQDAAITAIMEEIENYKAESSETISAMDAEIATVASAQSTKKARLAFLRKWLRIRFDVDAPVDRVKGYVFNEKKEQLYNFDFSTSEHSRFFIANKIWELISKSYES